MSAKDYRRDDAYNASTKLTEGKMSIEGGETSWSETSSKWAKNPGGGVKRPLNHRPVRPWKVMLIILFSIDALRLLHYTYMCLRHLTQLSRRAVVVNYCVHQVAASRLHCLSRLQVSCSCQSYLYWCLAVASHNWWNRDAVLLTDVNTNRRLISIAFCCTMIW